MSGGGSGGSSRSRRRRNRRRRRRRRRSTYLSPSSNDATCLSLSLRSLLTADNSRVA